MTGRMRKQNPAPKRPGIRKKAVRSAYTASVPSDYGTYRIRFVPLKPTLRERWVRFVNGIGGRLLRYGR